MMEATKQNIFTVGPQALGESFIGREEELRELKSSILYGSGSFSLVGPTRIGKSSLAQRLFQESGEVERCVQIWVNMAVCKSAYHFWSSIWENLYIELERAGAWNQIMERQYKKFADLSESDDWYTIMSNRLPQLLKEAIRAGFRWILVIDEFDAVSRVFGNVSHYYQFLRNLYSEPYKANGIVISRRPVFELEKVDPNISTFHGVFNDFYLKSFSATDMAEFYARLQAYKITLTDEGKDSLKYYTGNIPYLCCMFADKMVVHLDRCTCYGEEGVSGIFTELLPQIEEYYNDLDKQLKSDGHWESVLQLCFGSYEIWKNTRKAVTLQSMGYINCEMVNGTDSYYAYSRDYMQHVISGQLDLPIWDTILAGERKLKSLLNKVYPDLSATPTAPGFSRTDELRVEQACPGFRIDWDRTYKDCTRCSARKGSPATILEAISLGPVVGAITYYQNWNDRFAVYFQGDSSWKDNKLHLIAALRDPLAHNQGQYITPEELTACAKYCEDLLRLDMGPDIHA